VLLDFLFIDLHLASLGEDTEKQHGEGGLGVVKQIDKRKSLGASE